MKPLGLHVGKPAIGARWTTREDTQQARFGDSLVAVVNIQLAIDLDTMGFDRIGG